jgi:predicted DNA-binding transcriptional regulator AlpA
MSGLVWTDQHPQVKTDHLQKTANRKRMRRIPKGRLSGQDHQNAVLTDGEVEAMRDLREQGKTYEWLADKFEVRKLDLSESTLRRMIGRGEFIDAVRVSPNRVAFAADAVDTWLANRPSRLSSAGNHRRAAPPDASTTCSKEL